MILAVWQIRIRDPRSGAFLTPGSGMNIPDHLSESSETVFRVKVLKIFSCGSGTGTQNLFDPGSRMEKFRSGIRDKHPGSATLDIGKLIQIY